MNRNRFTRSVVLTCSMFVCAGLSARTQTADDVGEISAYGGVSFGPLGAHGSVGATSGVEFTKYTIAIIDTSFLPLGTRSLGNSPLVTTSRLYDFNVTLHAQIPIKRRWAPYVLAGTAFLYNTYRVPYAGPDGAVYYHGRYASKFGFETGAGVRYFIGEHWGVRGEYRYTISTRSFDRLLGGVFYQFEGLWPIPFRGSKRRTRKTPCQYPQFMDLGRPACVEANTAARIR